MSKRWLNIGCGPHRAPDPWVNVDRVRIPGHIEPDIVTMSIRRLPQQPAQRVYLGHVLEHMPWDVDNRVDVRYFLRGVFHIMEPGGEVMVVGPDCERAIKMHKAGSLSTKMLWQILEDDRVHGDQADAGHTGAGGRHYWNCTVPRVVRLLEEAGFVGIDEMPVQHVPEPWPVVARVGWQLAVTAVKPS